MRSGHRRGLLILWLFFRGAVVGVPLLAVLWHLDRGWCVEWPQELVIVRHGDRAWFVQSSWASGEAGCFAIVAKPRDLKDFSGKVREVNRYDVEFVDALLERLGSDETLWATELGRFVPYASGYAIWNDNDLHVEDGGLVLFLYDGQTAFLPTRLRWHGVLFWLLLLSLIGNAIWIAARSPYRWLVRRRRLRAGCCKRCGYDLTGLVPNVPCPECGQSSQPPALPPA